MEKSITVRNAYELAAALDLTAADAMEWEFRHELTNKIVSVVKERKLTHAALARSAKTSRSRLTAILNRNMTGVSTDLLLRILAALGYRPTVRFLKIGRAA